MKALIIEEKDVKELLSKLELEKYHQHERQNTADEMHRWFHYVVITWFQEQGYKH